MWKEEFIKYLRYEKNYSPLTEISYLNDITQFEEFIKEKDEEITITSIDSDIIRIWISTLIEQGLKPSSVNRKLSTLKSFFKFLLKKEAIDKDPTKLLVGPKTKRKIPSFANDREISKILDDEGNFSDDFKGARDRFLIELLYLTGMRRSEIISIKYDDINFHNSTIRVTGKRNKQRLIPFSDSTKEKINNYINIRDEEIKNKSPFLFVKEDGKALYPELVYEIINVHLSSITTLSKKSPHVLRHSFATEMLNNGAEINAIKEILGHSSLASTEIYTHVTFEEMIKTYHNAHPRAKK